METSKEEVLAHVPPEVQAGLALHPSMIQEAISSFTLLKWHGPRPSCILQPGVASPSLTCRCWKCLHEYLASLTSLKTDAELILVKNALTIEDDRTAFPISVHIGSSSWMKTLHLVAVGLSLVQDFCWMESYFCPEIPRRFTFVVTDARKRYVELPSDSTGAGRGESTRGFDTITEHTPNLGISGQKCDSIQQKSCTNERPTATKCRVFIQLEDPIWTEIGKAVRSSSIVSAFFTKISSASVFKEVKLAKYSCRHFQHLQVRLGDATPGCRMQLGRGPCHLSKVNEAMAS
ncbi:hypothetical protein Dimus_036806 [Dionaea muscipula]